MAKQGREHPASAPAPARGGRVRVLCVDDHAVLIAGLRAHFALDGAIEVVGALGSADGLLDTVQRLHPDVVLLDVEMPGPDAFETSDRLRRMHSNIRVVFLSAHVREGYLAAAYRCGAWGYFAKSDDLDDISDGIREVARSRSGTFVLGPKVRALCAAPTRPHAPAADGAQPTRFDHLSDRELEVLRLIGKGLSRVQIAHELSRSAKTIDGHQDRIMKKLGVSSRAELMRFAIREGLAEA